MSKPPLGGIKNISRSILVVGIVLALLPTTIFASPTLTQQNPKLVGEWSTPFWEGGDHSYDPPSSETSKAYPTAVTAVVLPDKRVLYWNGLEGTEDSVGLFLNSDVKWSLENSRARILDLGKEEPEWTIPTPERGTTDEAQDIPGGATHDLFCSDQKLLWDGTLLIAGGLEARYDDVYGDVYGDDETRIFDPKTNTFRSSDPMRERRWYPSMVTLPDGQVMVTSGVRQVAKSALNPEPSFSQVRLTEIYNPVTQKWVDGGMNDLSLPLYSRLHLLPDGRVFYGGAAQSWTPLGSTADQATWGAQRIYDPATKNWTIPGHSLYGVRNGATSTLLRLEAPYKEAEILIAGGTAGVAPSTYLGTTLSEVVRWTSEGRVVNESPPKAPFAGLAGDPSQLRNRRWYGSSVVLPTGEVVMVNGGDKDDLIDPGSAEAVRTAEIYDPQTGSWRELATGTRDRVYHNSAILLPDGSVLVGGNSPAPAHYLRHDFPVTASNNFKDSTFEIYKPPYLFRGPRPVVSSVVPVSNGRAIKVALGEETSANDISELVLVRMPAATHTIDADMRALKLEYTVAGSNLIARLPGRGDGRILPPGPYYVFAMRNTSDGRVPSIAQVILVQPVGAGKVVARLP